MLILHVGVADQFRETPAVNLAKAAVAHLRASEGQGRVAAAPNAAHINAVATYMRTSFLADQPWAASCKRNP